MTHVLKIEPHIPDRNEFRILNKSDLKWNEVKDSEDTLYWIVSNSGRHRNKNINFNFKRILKYV